MTDARPARIDMRETNKTIIARYRASGGAEEGLTTLVLLTTVGARTGAPHTTPVCVQEEGDRLIVAGSRGGAATHPQWYRNLVAQPEVIVEYRHSTYRARAVTVPNSRQRDEFFARLNEVIPGLYGYQDKAANHRQIPIVSLERVE